MREYTVKIKPLTLIWTGDKNRRNTSLRETGILGSLRWWYEALIRGLGGSACDPTGSKCDGKSHCDACELFGCTGWARKFRLEVEKSKDDEIDLRFIEIRGMKDVEWALLNKVLIIISQHGALGGKIAESKYGLIEIGQNDLNKFSLNKTQIDDYLKKKGDKIDTPNLLKFIFINKNLSDDRYKELKDNLPFLKGQSGKGKRYFYKIKDNKPFRLFAYAENDEEYRKIINFLQGKVEFVEGSKLLEELK